MARPRHGHVEQAALGIFDLRLRRLYGEGIVVETATGAGTLVRIRVPRSQPEHETVAR